MFQEVAEKFSRKLMFTMQVLTGGHTKRKMMNPSFEEVDLLVASLGALSKLTTTGRNTAICIEFGICERIAIGHDIAQNKECM
jgi:hypothetical protein